MDFNMVLMTDDGEQRRFYCENGFVSRVVAAVFAENRADAERVCKILNEHAQRCERSHD
ncbi:hypothetical protein [Labrenzia sp. OB1]|uniref:hypothetical protein n=1 Tax=Labrenzia sp. OB1 TaxID=1561204 RepID=UPI0012E7869E|nr:hypothetical protein [Labrenzia sp. OB1]